MKVQILKDNVVTNEASFDSAEEMSSWLEYHKAAGSFGKSEYEKVVVPEQIIEHEAVAKVVGERMESVAGVFKLNKKAVLVKAVPARKEIVPAVTELVPAEYQIVDVTDQLQLENGKQEALAYLNATDYKVLKALELGVLVAPEILQARAAARLKLQ